MKINIKKSLDISTATIKQFAFLVGSEINEFNSINEIDLSSLNEDNILYGSIQDILFYLSFLKKEYNYTSYPIELDKYLKRFVSQCFFKTIKKQNIKNLFIKPTKLKQFTGFVLTGEFSDYLQMVNVSDNDLVWLSSKINLLAEYRVFVYDKQILDIKPYRGDCSLGFNLETVKSMISDYKTAPIAYALDIGITDNKNTVLVEMNDGFSLGAYGLSTIEYGKIIVNRWRELLNI